MREQSTLFKPGLTRDQRKSVDSIKAHVAELQALRDRNRALGTRLAIRLADEYNYQAEIYSDLIRRTLEATGEPS